MASVGCIITVHRSGAVVARRPIWPLPPPGLYPKAVSPVRTEYFFPTSYLRFRLGDLLFAHEEIINIGDPDENS